MTESPIACTLTGGEQIDRRKRWRRLRDETHAVRVETATGLRLEFARSDDAARELRELAELERACCAFATWTVRETGDLVSLEVDAQGDAVEVLHGMFRTFESSTT